MSHCDRLQGNIVFLISICLMRWLRQPWRSTSTRSQPSEKEQVSKSNELKIPTDSYEEDQLHTWSTSISVQLERMKQYQDSKTWSAWPCRMTMCKIRRKMGSCTAISEWNAFRPDLGRIVQSRNYKIPLNFGLWWPCMIKKRLETMDTELSTVEDCSETSYWLDDEKSEFQSMEQCCGKVISHQESIAKQSLSWEESGKGFSVEGSRTMLQRRLLQFQSWHSRLETGNRSSSNSQRRKGRSSSPASYSKAKHTLGERRQKG